MKNPENLEGRLGAGLDERLEKGRARFVPECDTEYTTNVYCRLLVEDCDRLTEAETNDICDCLEAKGRRSAQAICELNERCPNARLVSYRFRRIVCENRLLEVDLVWTFRCVA